jgi:sugar/nucleoside kinase (ribokinase family)
MQRHKGKTEARALPRKAVRRSVICVGLVALDVIDDRIMHTVGYGVGGTAANVSSILSVLGWHSAVVGRINEDWAGQEVLSELKRFGVDTALAALSPKTATPVIVERLKADVTGMPHHSFSFSCPKCGARLPSFQTITRGMATDVLKARPEAPTVLFIDRVSPASVQLALAYKQKGAAIFFEPTSVTDERHFQSLIALADVIKYSVDRIDELDRSRYPTKAIVEIQTLGAGGLRYRSRRIAGTSTWHHLDAEAPATLRDSSGAGDWMTAFLINEFADGGSRLHISHTHLKLTLMKAQRIAAWSCNFVGALGALKGNSRDVVCTLVKAPSKVDRLKDFAIGAETPMDEFAAAALTCCDSVSSNRKRA